VEGFKKASFF